MKKASCRFFHKSAGTSLGLGAKVKLHPILIETNIIAGHSPADLIAFGSGAAASSGRNVLSEGSVCDPANSPMHTGLAVGAAFV